VFEQHQFKAMFCNNGHSLIKSINDEVILLKRFTDESKNDLGKLLVSTEITHFE
jgi:hypothetical protein